MKSPLFDILKVDGNGVVTLVAYRLYKRHKRHKWAWAGEFERAYGRPPMQADCMAFAQAVSTPDQLARYREAAKDMLSQFAEYSVDEARPAIMHEAVTVRMEQAAARVEQRSSFIQQVGQGLVATAINTFVLVMLALGIRLMGVDLLSVLSQVG